ncbi:hypothetical protein HanIR_Chr14g0692121 [Helianthus annuus]|nr:hypothetical protein HanIR_Chr14g0692121 [Helianthus annuus]
MKNQSAAPRPKRGALVHGWIYPMRRLSIWRLRERWGTRKSRHVRTCSFRRVHGRGGDVLRCSPVPLMSV